MSEDDRYNTGVYRGPLIDELREIIEVWEVERNSHRERQLKEKGDDNAQRVWNLSSNFAEKLMWATEDFSSPKVAAGFNELCQQLFKYLASDAMVKQTIDEDLILVHAYQMLGVAERAATRQWHLIELVKDIQPSPRGSDFLRRVSTCYLRSMDTEAIAMCRAVLDVEFQSEISNNDCVEVHGQRFLRSGVLEEGSYSFVERIVTAECQGRITKDVADKVHGVRKTANRIMHEKPADQGEAFGVLRDTLAVLEGLRLKTGSDEGAIKSGEGGRS
jgi:hypothetical protein